MQTLADRLAAGVRLGALTAKGFGKVSAADVRISTYDFSDFDDVRRWLFRKDAKCIAHGSKAAGKKRAGVFSVDAAFAIRRSLIVRENDVDEKAAERKVKSQQKKSGADFLIPGTSIKGALRHRALEILTILKKPVAALDSLMGCSTDARRQKSRFLVDEASSPKRTRETASTASRAARSTASSSPMSLSGRRSRARRRSVCATKSRTMRRGRRDSPSTCCATSGRERSPSAAKAPSGADSWKA